MKGYIICFLIAMLFAYFSNQALKKDRNGIGILFLILSLFTVCFFAGVRSIDVGADIKTYVTYLQYKYVNEGVSFFQGMSATKLEILFSLTVYIASFFKNINITLFFIEFVCALPIYLFAYKERKKYAFLYTIFIFLITMYAKSFNLMRQFIAISIIIYSTSFFKRKEYKKTILLYIMAILFHYSSIVCLLIYVLIYITEMEKSKQNRNFLLIALIGCCIIFVVFIDKIMLLLPNKYEMYMNSEYAINSFSISSFTKKLFWLVISLVLLGRSKKDKNEYAENLQVTTLLLIDIVLYFLSVKVTTFGRLGNYFLYIAYFYLIPKISKLFKQKVLSNCIIFIVLVLLWYNMTVVNYEADRAYPYVSNIIEILNDKKY